MRLDGVSGDRSSRFTRHPELVRLDFTATTPNQLWVTDLEFVASCADVAYLCFCPLQKHRRLVGSLHHENRNRAGRDSNGSLVWEEKICLD